MQKLLGFWKPGRFSIFGSNFVYFYILTLSDHWYENGDEVSTSMILAGLALLLKMLINLELCYSFG